MEDDHGIVTSSCCSEWPLVSDRNSIYYLKKRLQVVKGYMKYKWLTFECPRISPVEEPVSIRKAWPNLVSTEQISLYGQTSLN